MAGNTNKNSNNKNNKTARSLKDIIKLAKPALKRSSDSASAKKKQWKNQAAGSKRKQESDEGAPKSKKEFNNKDKDFKKKNFKGKNDEKKPAKPLTPAEYRARKPHFNLVEGLKSKWNLVRDRSTTDEERQKELEVMFKQIKGHVLDVTLRHDASRCVQTILQFGSNSQKQEILAELCEKFADVSKSPYGHFAILKAITYCNSPEDMKKMTKALSKHVVSLSSHVIGARIVESVFQLFPSNLIRELKSELYGKRFTLLIGQSPRNLRNLIELIPNKRASILDHMRDLIVRFIQKGLLEFTFSHTLLWEYVNELQLILDEYNEKKPEDLDENDKKKLLTRINEIVDLLSDHLPKLMSTKVGSKVSCFVITHASAKDRKRILKSLKSHVSESLLHHSASLAVLRIVDLNDDTVNIHKTLFDELKGTKTEIKYTPTGEVLEIVHPSWVRAAHHPQGYKLLVRIFNPKRQHLEPEEEEIFNKKSLTSKKDSEVRRKEHLTYLRTVLLKNFVLKMKGSKLSGFENEDINDEFSDMTVVESLLRNRFGSKVIESLLVSINSEQLMDRLVQVLCSLDISFDEELVDDEMEDDEEEEEAEEEEEEEEAEEEEEEEEAEEDELEDDELGIQDDEFDVEDEEEYNDQLRDAEEDKKKAISKKNKKSDDSSEDEDDSPAVVVKQVKLLLPIHEDPVVHAFLKKFFRYEAYVASQSEDVNKKNLKKLEDYKQDNEQLNTSLKRDDEVSSSIFSTVDTSLFETSSTLYLGDKFITTILENSDTLSNWLSSNRGCFAIHDLFLNPNLLDKINPLFDLAKDIMKKGWEEDSEGAKALNKLYNHFNSKVPKTPAKSISETPSKSSKTPAKSTETPAKSTKTPAKSTETPAKSTKTPAKTPKKN